MRYPILIMRKEQRAITTHIGSNAPGIGSLWKERTSMKEERMLVGEEQVLGKKSAGRSAFKRDIDA
jgi:hypothetical protein